MKPAPFAYHRAYGVDDALEWLQDLGEEAKLIAGGQSLVAMMNFRLARPGALVDIGRIPDLRYLRRDGAVLHIGALTSHHAIETAAGMPELSGFGVLPRTAPFIGHYPIRTRGTIGGSLAHGDSTAEWCILSVLLDARIVLRSPRGERLVAASQFFQGFLTTDVAADEMVVEVQFPRPAPHAALVEFAQRRGDFAMVAAAVDLDVQDGVCVTGRVVLGGVHAVPLRVAAAESALAGAPATAATFSAAGEAAAAEIRPGSDVHGDADYRRALTRTLVQRACAEAVAGRDVVSPALSP